MKQLLLYVQDPHALKNWSQATDLTKKILYTLDIDQAEYSTGSALLLVQLPESETEQQKIETMLRHGFTVILFSNMPSPQEGVQWFQKGIKGYLNTFAQTERINQAVETVLAGNIWLGQGVMQSLIQAVSNPVNRKDTSWKEQLSDREIETAESVLLGKTNQEIAELMHISERTVKAHMHSILEKLEAKDRLNLVIKLQNWPN
jgi:DNA-binding NarL/FixJ family response regulator